ncbi:MAG: ABC transporter substrate-binding protein [Desulfamplus sp.]|nr:ABC transporter substrate-binding protein [Desulfamplus sp.]
MMCNFLRPIPIFYFIFYLSISLFITSPILAASSEKSSSGIETQSQSTDNKVTPAEKKNNPEEKPSEKEQQNIGKRYKIVAIQHQNYLSYTNAYKGFINKLKKSEYWEKIDVELYNAKSDLSALDKKIKELSKSSDVDLLFTIGTQSTKKTADKIKNIPIVFTAVATPIEAGIIKNWTSSGKNITGVGTPYQITKSIAQAYSIAKFNSLGVTYLSGSPNHEAAVKEIKEFCKKNGVKFVHHSTPFKQNDGKPFPNDVVKKQLQESLDYILPKVDVFYVQASATYEKNFSIFRKAFQKYKVPSLGELIFIRKGVIMGIGPNDYIFGQQSADYAIEILFNGIKPSDLPMDIGTKFSILANLQAARIVEFPPIFLMSILNSADAIYQKIDEW